jgi:uncharacterized repeat protein (TIGR03943 family)
MGSGAVRTVVLAAWAALFVLLWATDEGLRYLGPRTQWVIPFGAVTLTAAAIGHAVLAASRRRDAAALTRGEAAGSFVLLLPIFALLLAPQPELGAQAASKKRPSNEILFAQLPTSSQAAAKRDPLAASFIDVAVAALSPREGAALGLEPGARVRVHGLVVHDTDVPRSIGLTRFYISCCAADALPILVPVDVGGRARPPEDRWLLVTGRLRRRGEGLVVVAERAEATPAPRSPYVSVNDGGRVAGPVAPRRATTTPARPRVSGRDAGFSGRAANVYDRYYDHCKEFTPEALAWPRKARSAEDAASIFAGPPRRYREPAYRVCLAGLQAGEARITLRDLFARMATGAEG